MCSILIRAHVSDFLCVLRIASNPQRLSVASAEMLLDLLHMQLHKKPIHLSVFAFVRVAASSMVMVCVAGGGGGGGGATGGNSVAAV